jgi:hypothetical protein
MQGAFRPIHFGAPVQEGTALDLKRGRLDVAV